MDDSLKNHSDDVAEWLERNVLKFSEPKVVSLFDFFIDWETFSGDFRVAFDSTLLSKKFRFSLEVSGKVMFHLPMFHSPLGVPGSYRAIDISEKTELAILKGLRESIPRIQGAGIDRDTGKQITYHTPVAERIDPVKLENAIRTINQGYSIQIPLKNL